VAQWISSSGRGDILGLGDDGTARILKLQGENQKKADFLLAGAPGTDDFEVIEVKDVSDSKVLDPSVDGFDQLKGTADALVREGKRITSLKIAIPEDVAGNDQFIQGLYHVEKDPMTGWWKLRKKALDGTIEDVKIQGVNVYIVGVKKES